jgi:hypothetical protein
MQLQMSLEITGTVLNSAKLKIQSSKPPSLFEL